MALNSGVKVPYAAMSKMFDEKLEDFRLVINADIDGKLAPVVERLTVVENRHDELEALQTTIDNIERIALKLLRWAKAGVPILATALVTSGIATGRVAAFLSAIFSAN